MKFDISESVELHKGISFDIKALCQLWGEYFISFFYSHNETEIFAHMTRFSISASRPWDFYGGHTVERETNFLSSFLSPRGLQGWETITYWTDAVALQSGHGFLPSQRAVAQCVFNNAWLAQWFWQHKVLDPVDCRTSLCKEINITLLYPFACISSVSDKW